MNRRDFIKTLVGLGGVALCSPLMESCTTTTSTPQGSTLLPSPTTTKAAMSPESSIASPTETITPLTGQEDFMTRVAFVKTNDRSSGLNMALDLLEINPIKGKSLFLKPNFNSADPAPGSTHNDTLSSLIQRLQVMGASRITIGDRSGMGDTRRAMREMGIFNLANDLGCETIVFDELEASEWELMRIEGAHWRDGFAVARPVLEADGVVQTCCLKTHRFGGHFTMSLKNSVGMVARQVPGESYDYMNELHSSPDQRRMIAEINMAYVPDLIVLDGIEAFVTGGPDRGARVESNVILAGTDRVAIDAVGVAILRYFGTTEAVSKGAIFQQEQISRAVELGLGITRPENIELITGDEESEAYAVQIGEILTG